MERSIGIGDQDGRTRDEHVRTERLRHRRAAAERCVRAGLLRLCTVQRPGRG